MTNVNADSELVDAVRGMTVELAGLRADTQELRAYGTRNRRLIRVMAASLVFDVLLSLGLAFAVHRAQEASDRASRAASATVVTCRSSNEARAVQTDLWDYILTQFNQSIAETPAESAERSVNVGKFKVYIATAFAQRDCDALLKGTDDRRS
jgi:hypothetical protein